MKIGPKRVTFLKEKFEKVALFACKNEIFVTEPKDKKGNSYFFEWHTKNEVGYTIFIR